MTEIHVFLAAGQSNMAGRGRPYGAELDPLEPRLLEYGANRRKLEPASVPLDMPDIPNSKAGLSPATTFAWSYLAARPSIAVLIVPAAYGNSGFSTTASGYTWDPEVSEAGVLNLYWRSVEQTKAALREAGPMASLKAVLWHQGESDAELPAQLYADKLDGLVNRYRIDLESPELPFLVGQMAPEGVDASPGKSAIDRVHAETPARLPWTGFAPAARGAVNPGDDVHFSRRGVELLGESYLAAYWPIQPAERVWQEVP